MTKLWLALTALQSGKSLENPETWKKVQLLSPILLAIIGAIVKIFDLGISEPDQATIVLGLASLAVSVNHYLVLATSKKIGF